MKFVITAGGTAGHINPALALAEELKSQGHNVVFAGTPNRLESKLVPQAGYEFKGFSAKGFQRSKPLSIFSSALSIIKSTKDAKSWLMKIKPDVVIGFGCYVSLAICRAAKKLKIPYAIHEQNSVMGLANKYLSKSASVTCLTYEHADTGKCKNVKITGNPVRRSIFEAKKIDGRKMLNIPNNAFMLLVFGGSLGAKKINSAFVSIANEILKRPNLYIVHITGEKLYEEVKSSLSINDEFKERYILLPYQNNMGECLAAADVCVSRAGASTCAELTARALPALLIPYPYATENHQFYNAKSLLDAGCIMYLPDDSVTSNKFDDAIIRLINDEELREEMCENYQKFDAENSAKRIANILLNL